LFPLEEIPGVLAECERVLRPGGRIGVVSMATVKEGQNTTVLEKAYVWMHRHFPHIVDCQPIDVEAVVTTAGFQIAKVVEMEIWTMPVRRVVGTRSLTVDPSPRRQEKRIGAFLPGRRQYPHRPA